MSSVSNALVAVVAIGGNSLILDNSQPDTVHQWDAVRQTASQIAAMIEAGWTVVGLRPFGAFTG